ncbi:MAG: hypothetical protein JXA36_00330 [Coriobacteriia bacterium]|nr:hypothetical protein [Coriobacteriia bacterium]
MRGDATFNRLLDKFEGWLSTYEAWYGSRLDKRPPGDHTLISLNAGPLERTKAKALVSHGWKDAGTVQVRGTGYSHTYRKYVKY